MIKDITLGQFFPGDSLLHRMDPRMKIVLMVASMVGIFLADTATALAFVAVFTVILTLISKIKLSVIVKGLKPIVFVMIITAVFNLLLVKGEGDPLVSFWVIRIYTEGVAYAIMIAVRIVCIVICTSVLITYTTSPIDLTDGLERLLSPLKKLHVPVHDLSMMMTMALRFIPTLIDETDRIMNAQKARGADINSGGLIKRIKALIPIMIPLFVSSFHRAEELATAMECRCYRGDSGRTRMKVLRTSAVDWVFLAVFLAFCTAVVMINIYLPPLYAYGHL